VTQSNVLLDAGITTSWIIILFTGSAWLLRWQAAVASTI
jgi:hypothetical protein